MKKHDGTTYMGKWRMRAATALFALLAAAFSLTGCGSEQPPEEKLDFPEPEEVISSLEEEGYQVESFDDFEELDSIKVTRIKAVKGESYLDVCYNVASEDELNKIIEYYSANYKNYNIFSNIDIVFCYSDEDVVQIADLKRYQ